jgi:hypothetical protein
MTTLKNKVLSAPHMAPIIAMAALNADQVGRNHFYAHCASLSGMSIKKPDHLTEMVAGLNGEIERIGKLGKGAYVTSIVDTLKSTIEDVQHNYAVSQNGAANAEEIPAGGFMAEKPVQHAQAPVQQQ